MSLATWVRQTSVEAYHNLVDNQVLSRKRRVVYEWLWHHGPATGAQVIQGVSKFDKYIVLSQARCRLGELREQGVVVEVGHGPCPVTGENVIWWDVTDRPMPLDLPKNVGPKRRCRCEHLNGVIATRANLMVAAKNVLVWLAPLAFENPETYAALQAALADCENMP